MRLCSLSERAIESRLTVPSSSGRGQGEWGVFSGQKRNDRQDACPTDEGEGFHGGTGG
jgi:hypothetical protein